MTLYFHEAQHVVLLHLADAVGLDELADGLIIAIEYDIDVVLTGGPYIVEHLAAFGFEDADKLIAEPVQCFAQGLAPFLIPTGVAAGVTAAVCTPALYAVHAAPGAG